MVEAVMLWNEPNNLSHWDFHIDPEWMMFAEMTIAAAGAIRKINPNLKIVLGGMSPVDANFVRLLAGHGVLDQVDVVAIHGFPLDWNHWSIHDWPQKVEEIRRVADRPVWVSEAGASSFGAEEVQVFGMKRTAELLLPVVDRVHWYSLFDLPSSWTATTRHITPVLQRTPNILPSLLSGRFKNMRPAGLIDQRLLGARNRWQQQRWRPSDTVCR